MKKTLVGSKGEQNFPHLIICIPNQQYTYLVSDLALEWTWEFASLNAREDGGNTALLSIMLLSNSGATAISSSGDSEPISSSDDSSVNNR